MSYFSVTGSSGSRATTYTFLGYNRKTEWTTQDGVTIVSKSYSNDESDWLTSTIDRADPAHPVTISYDYDANGNTLKKSDSRTPGADLLFAYDAANRLVQSRKGATLTGQYDYNAAGLWVRHYGSERGNIETFYDDGAVLEEYVTGAGGGFLAHYRYADRLLSLATPSGSQFYHLDALGSTVDLTDQSGSVQTRYTLGPWGEITSQVGTSVNRMVFTGLEHDEQTGLINFGVRYYDPDSARFLTQDSYLGEPGTPPSLHRYLYAYSNPTVYIDLMGYLSWDEFKDGAGNAWSGIQGGLSGAAQVLPEVTTKTNAAFDESLNNAYETGVNNGVPGFDNDIARGILTAGTTFTKGIMAMGSAPLSKAVETIEYAKDTSQLQNFPLYATSVRNTYRASEAYARDGSFANGVNLVGAASGAVLETAAVGAGAKAMFEKPSLPKSGITVESVSGRLNEMMRKDVGYNVTPEAIFNDYSHVGRHGSFVTDYRAIGEVLGPVRANQKYSVGLFSKPSINQISFVKELQLEKALGLNYRSLEKGGGFRVTRITELSKKNPRLPTSAQGNAKFLGYGQGLPKGGPELIVDSMPTNPWPPK